jgi:hypothetical protein
VGLLTVLCHDHISGGEGQQGELQTSRSELYILQLLRPGWCRMAAVPVSQSISTEVSHQVPVCLANPSDDLAPSTPDAASVPASRTIDTFAADFVRPRWAADLSVEDHVTADNRAGYFEAWLGLRLG